MRALYPEVLGQYYTLEEQEFIRYCADKCEYTYKIADSMTDGEKLILFARIIGDIASKNGSVMSELSRHKKKIEANKYKQQKCDEAIAEAENVTSEFLKNYCIELKIIISDILEKHIVEKKKVMDTLAEVRKEINKLSGLIRRLISSLL